MDETERLRAMVDRLLPVAQLYVAAFKDDETMTLFERLALQEIEEIVADPDRWTPDRPLGTPAPPRP